MSDPTQPVGQVETTTNEAAPVEATPVNAPVAAAQAAEAPAAPAKEKKEKKERTPRTTLLRQNGVPRPGQGVTAKVWEIADRISAETGAPAPRKAVVEACTADGINPATIATQYGRWRRFNGLKSEPRAVAAPAAAAPADATVEAPKA